MAEEKAKLRGLIDTAEEANILPGEALARSDDEVDDEAVKFANTSELALHWRMTHDKAGRLQEKWTRSLRGVLDKSKAIAQGEEEDAISDEPLLELLDLFGISASLRHLDGTIRWAFPQSRALSFCCITVYFEAYAKPR
jgi:hypothetical protein